MKRPIEVAYEVKHILTIQLSYSTARFLPKINENLHTQTTLKENIQSSCIYTGPELGSR